MQTNIAPPETGTLVFSADGEELGPITEATSEYICVKKGLIFRKEVYLPLSSIVGTALGGDGVQVNLTKDEIENGDYSTAPTGETDAGTTVEAGEHNTVGATTPYGTTGASADMAASRPGTPPRDTGDTVPGGQSPDTGLYDDTDATQRAETEHESTDDPTSRP